MKATKFELQTIQEFAPNPVHEINALTGRFWVGTSTMEKQGSAKRKLSEPLGTA